MTRPTTTNPWKWKRPHAVFALDVGATAGDRQERGTQTASNLGWAGPVSNGVRQTGNSLCALAAAVQAVLQQDKSKGDVHLYVEAPLFLPGNPRRCCEADLTHMREWEAQSVHHWARTGVIKKYGKTDKLYTPRWPWTGNGGGASGMMSTQELAWLLAKLASTMKGTIPVRTCTTPTCSLITAQRTEPALVIMEAFAPGNLEVAPKHAIAKVDTPGEVWGGTWGSKTGATSKHVCDARRILDVAAHLGNVPMSCTPTCGCKRVTPINPAWYTTSGWGNGTMNLVASAVFQAGMKLAKGWTTAHGVIFWP